MSIANRMNKNAAIGKKKAPYPTKTSINLVKSDTSQNNTLVTLLLFVLFLIVLAIFTKFAVIDPLASGVQSSREVTAARAELDALKVANADYAELSEQYSKYIVSGLSDEELNLVSREDVVDLITTKIINSTIVSSINVQGNIIEVTCVGLDLNGVSSIVENLKQDSRVSFVSVSTVQDQEGKTSTATMSITLKSPTDSNGQTQDSANPVDAPTEGE